MVVPCNSLRIFEINIIEIVYGLLPIGLTIFIGFLAKHFLISEEAPWMGLNKVAFYLLMPCLVIATSMNAEITNIPGWSIVTVLVVALLLIIAVLGLFYSISVKSASFKASFSSVFQTATRWNVAISLAIANQIDGSEISSIIALAVIVLVPLINIINVALLGNLATDRRISLMGSLGKIITNPIIVGCLIGISLFMVQIEVWQPVQSTLNTLADASIVVILLSVGAGLELSNLSVARHHIFISCALKLIFMPLIVLTISLFLEFSHTVLIGMMVVSAVPTAVHGYVLAREMGGDAPLYANIASLQLAISFLTIPFWIWIAEML